MFPESLNMITEKTWENSKYFQITGFLNTYNTYNACKVKHMQSQKYGKSDIPYYRKSGKAQTIPKCRVT